MRSRVIAGLGLTLAAIGCTLSLAVWGTRGAGPPPDVAWVHLGPPYTPMPSRSLLSSPQRSAATPFRWQFARAAKVRFGDLLIDPQAELIVTKDRGRIVTWLVETGMWPGTPPPSSWRYRLEGGARASVDPSLSRCRIVR